MERSVIDPLLAAHRQRVFALDRYIEARDALKKIQQRGDRFNDWRTTLLRTVNGNDALREYAEAEAKFVAADIDLQRFHRRLDIGCVVVCVGRLRRVHDLVDGVQFAFVDEHPTIEAHRRLHLLAGDDWLRIWSPDRAHLLLTGKLWLNEKSGSLQLGKLPLFSIASWFDRGFPSEFAAG